MADINVGGDGLLTTTLADNDRVLITRSSTGQQVASMTVSDFKNKIQPDYSSLSERKTYRKAIGPDGVVRDLYVRTFVGALTNSGVGVVDLVVSGIYSAYPVYGTVILASDGRVPVGHVYRKYPFTSEIGDVSGDNLLACRVDAAGRLCLVWDSRSTALPVGTKYSVTIEYTRI